MSSEPIFQNDTVKFMWVDLVKDIYSKLDQMLAFPQNHEVFHFIAASTLVQIGEDSEFSGILKKGNLICDSRVIEILSAMLGSRVERIRGADFLRLFFSKELLTNRHLFVGSTPEVMENLKSNLQSIAPITQNISFVCPSIDLKVEQQVELLKSKFYAYDFDYVWIAMGSPKQDYIANSLSGYFKASIFCVGAAVDFVSGAKSEAPKLIQSVGFEWFFRLLQEPRRLFSRYTIGNMKFLFLFFKWLLKYK